VYLIVQKERESNDDPFWTGDTLEELKSLVTHFSDEQTWRESPWVKIWRDSTAEGEWSEYGSPWVDAYDLLGSGAVITKSQGV
jgi:hypothetical protein